MEQCKYCDKKMPKHIMGPHIRKRHAETLGKVEVSSIEEAKPEQVIDSVSGGTVEPVRFNKVIVYLPKFFLSNDKDSQLREKGMVVEKKPTPNVVRDMYKKMWWSIKRNEMKIFDKEVGEYLLAKFGFLVRVQPHEIDTYRALQEEKEYSCNVCQDFETNTLLAYQQHMKSHNMSPEAQAMIASMQEAQPDGYVDSAEDVIRGNPRLGVDVNAGIPTGGTYRQPNVDSEGVEWVGPGSNKQQGMKLRPKFGAPGVFRGGTRQ